MLKHVSYRASSTSLSRPFGTSSCRGTSNTLGSPQDKTGVPNSLVADPSRTAPNSPLVSSYGRHARHHSLTPEATLYDGCDSSNSPSQFVTPDKTHLYRYGTNNNTLRGTSTLQRASDGVPAAGPNRSSVRCSLHYPQERDVAEDAVSLKPDDPLSKHKNDLRSVDSMTLRGELMPASHHLPLHPDGADNFSLHSAISLSSLCRSDLQASTTSLCASKVPVRVHLRQLRPDIEYKTLRLDADTTCRQLVEHLLQKLRLKHRDPNLFAVVLEAAVRGPGGAPPVKKRFLLEDSARPVELQQCRPRGEANFSITMRRGGVLRVQDTVLAPGSQYKSILVSYNSTAVDIIRLLLRCNYRTDDWRMFTLHEVCSQPYADRLLSNDARPLHVQNSWPKDQKKNCMLVLRRHLTQGLIESNDAWRRMSIGECSLDADVELDEHNSTCSSILTSASDSSRSRSSISSSTASVLSLASISSNGSSRCSFSSNSSSGVSSGSSSSYSPSDTPEKDPKQLIKRPLPPLPRTPTPISKIYPISVEENIQSYFSIPSDDEQIISPKEKDNKSEGNGAQVETVKRPLQPAPRRFLSFPADVASSLRVDSCKYEILEPLCSSKLFSKSWSASSCHTPPLWIGARGPTAQVWQNGSRCARIRSATISTPNEHMANLTIHCRSRSNDTQPPPSSTTLATYPNTSTSPSSPGTNKPVFSFRTACYLSRAQSASSINGSEAASKLSVDLPLIVPLSSKLRPLSLAPNSCIAFPSRPASLLSAQSQSSTTLRASSSSLCLTSSSTDGSSSSFVVTPSSQLSSITSQKYPQILSTAAPEKDEICNRSTVTTALTEFKFENNNTINRQPSDGDEVGKPSIALQQKLNEEKDKPKRTEMQVSLNKESLDLSGSCAPTHHSGTSPKSVPAENKHCPSCCRYDNCFYI